ncbi:MAG TPA: cupin domain-containing protein, partial [Polyangia bacterium]|nr:cupin domain-containing protein [Polyangia bacterium]
RRCSIVHSGDVEKMVKNVGNAEHYRWGEICDGWRLVNGSDLSVVQERIPPSAGEVRHYHQRARQCFFVLSGQLDIEVGEQKVRVSSGDALEVAPGEPHRVRNVGDADATFLVVSAPTTLGDRINLE